MQKQKQKQHLVSQARVCRDCWHRSFHFHQPSAVPTGDFSTCPRNARWFWFSACAARAPRAEPASHISLCWVMHEEGGQEVLCCDSYCALETWAGRVIPFPVYLSTSSFPVTVQSTSMFGKMYLWKKNQNTQQTTKTCFLDSIYRPKISSSLIYTHKVILDQLISQQGKEVFLRDCREKNMEGYVSVLSLESANFNVNKAHPTGPV